MSIYQSISFLLLVNGVLWGLYRCTPQPEVEKPSTSADHIAHRVEGEALGGAMTASVRVDTPVVPFLGVPDSLGWGWPQGDSTAAVRAARVDPGMLVYTEPPAGTDMPTLEPSEPVDPEIIWPAEP